MRPLSDKTALVTGASSGIGMAVARSLAREGCRLILLARRRERLSDLAAQLKQEQDCESAAVVVDVRRRTDLLKALEALPEGWKAIDLLVNNAGLSRGLEPIHAGDPDDWDEMIDVNVKGLLWVTKWVVTGMLKRGSGHVINIGSIAGYETYPGGVVYCASKFAVRALTRGLKMDLQGTPIRVTAVDPGLVETEFSLVRFKGDTARAKIPYQGLKPLTGEDIAEAVVWCATRPAHVNVMNVTLFPTAQASAQMVHREPSQETG